MASGKETRYSDRERELVLALYAVYGNATEVSGRTGIPRSTVSRWLKESSPDELEKLRTKQKEGFITEAWSVIGDAQALIRRRLSRALKSEDAIDDLVREIEDMSDEDLSREGKKELIRKLRAISCEDLSKVAVVMGTMYDKAMLVSKSIDAEGGASSSLEDFDADI